MSKKMFLKYTLKHFTIHAKQIWILKVPGIIQYS